jgi:F-type H+-transporting ATPase subunit epsilon
MATFQFSLVSPERLLFAGQVDQVDLPGTEGDFGVLTGHTAIVAALRPGIVTAIAGAISERFVVYGGLAEFASEELTVLADSATSVEDVDFAELRMRIEEMQESVAKILPGDQLDSALAMLDHYKSIQTNLSPTTAF